MATQPASLRPAADELEVSIFGPGVGECIVVHLGRGEWAIIDSCIDRESRRPVALAYLERLGIVPANAVKLFVVTHWHDDHTGGAAEVFRECVNATFFCSAALRSREFFEVVGIGGRAFEPDSGVKELKTMLGIIKSRAPAGVRPASVGPAYANANQCLWRAPTAAPVPVSVHALSPSPGAIQLALQEFARLIPALNAPKRRLVAQDPNQVAVVLHVEAGQHTALLGSDLETGTDVAAGWHAIVHSTARPQARAGIFKVAHHGSQNADDRRIWSELLTPEVVAVVTPFRRMPLPKPTDLERIKSNARHAFLTAPVRGSAPPQRDAFVERMAKATARDRRLLEKPMGHVQLRVQMTRAGATPTATLFGAAHAI